MFTSIGKYRYCNEWLLLDADPELGRYYRKLYSMYSFGCDVLQRPEADAHISIISKYTEKPERYYLKEYDGLEVEFSFDITPFDDGTYVWFTVVCEHAQKLRDELGLGLPHYPFHLTIGNRKFKNG